MSKYRLSYFGAHVSTAGGLETAINNATYLEINSIQVHPHPPQRWNSKKFEPGYENKFNELKTTSEVQKVFFHGIYLINLASPDARIRSSSVTSLIHYLDLMDRIGGDGVIFHVGSFKDEPDEELGFKRIGESINQILEKSDNNAKLILEVAAGSGRIVGSKIIDLKKIFDWVKTPSRVDFALDTQHLWASGYNYGENIDNFVEELNLNLGNNKIAAIHLNDSKTELDSKKDRHENLGEGLIGKTNLEKLIFHPDFKDIPFILETPNLKSLDTAKNEIDKFKTWIAL